MRQKLVFLSIAAALVMLALVSAPRPTSSASPAAQPRPWTITVGTDRTAYACGERSLPVPATDSCDAAIKVALEMFNSAARCAGLCPGGVPVPGKPVCREVSVRPSDVRRGGRAFQVSVPYSCRTGEESDAGESPCPEESEKGDDASSAQYVDEDRGPVSSLYPGVDTTTDKMYPLPCEPSLGGTLPPEVNDPPPPDEVAAEGTLDQFEKKEGLALADLLKNTPAPKIPPVPDFDPALCYLTTPNNTGPTPPRGARSFAGTAPQRLYGIHCDDPRFLTAGQPFEGRDIIYVHGLAVGHLKNWVLKKPEARRKWPQDPDEFLEPGGYFRKYAEDYWHGHIREHLFDPGNPANTVAGWQWTASDSSPRYNPKCNRYMVASWSANQTIEYAQHALLTQIQLAISKDKNVVTPPCYPKTHLRPFCANGCVVISHSTGSLVTSTALARAKMGHFGPGGTKIPKFVRAHVSFEGAVSGSRLASIGMAIAQTTTVKPPLFCAVFDSLLGLPNTCHGDLSFVANTILRDLMPPVAQGVWGPFVAMTTAPTLTVAGGHPVGNFAGATKILLPGLDDGVASMNSACGNPNLVIPHVMAPSGMVVTSNVKAFEMSENGAVLARSVKLFISHKDLTGGATPGARYLAGACTPHLSPTGMVMPVAAALGGTGWDARSRYPNHYSFIQGVIDHSYDGGGDSGNKWPSVKGDPAGITRQYLHHFGPNVEETSAVTDSAIYQQSADGTYLVHPSFANMHEFRRGRRLFKTKKRERWLWMRTYHLLDKWEQKQSSHYVYEFVLRR